MGVTFHRSEGWFRHSRFNAVGGVSLTLRAGETVGIVGESGSGKTTLGMAVLGLQPMSSGEVLAWHMPELAADERLQRVRAALAEVGLGVSAGLEDILERYPHQFSGGQRQRIAIARAVVIEPEILVLDEPTSALDVSVQKQVLTLLVTLQRRHGMSYLFISHDLSVIRAMAHRMLVMKDGVVVEQGECESILRNPQMPYTRALLQAVLYVGELDTTPP